MQTRKVMCKFELIECTLIVFNTSIFSVNNLNNFQYLENKETIMILLNFMLEIPLFSRFY